MIKYIKSKRSPVEISITDKISRTYYYPCSNAHPQEIVDWVNRCCKDGVKVFTYSSDLINQIRYLSYKKRIKVCGVKYGKHKFFIVEGKYLDKRGEVIDFPSGFFDAVLSQLLEIG